jgi:adenosine deaminase
MAALPSRFGDMVAEAANLAGRQNISYLELMHTMELFETILPMTAGIELSSDPAADYALLMDGPFGAALPEMLARARKDIDTAMARKDELLGCATQTPEPGCAVEIRFLNQSVRTLPPASVYAHFIFGWFLTEQDTRFVGINLVAPEDDFIALRDYSMHMAQLGFLNEALGARHIALHAGELTLGLVHPKDLRFHITEAVRIAGAKRIGHGAGIVFETDYKDLLSEMRDREIALEISLTSNETILGIQGDDHPYWIYKDAGVPLTLSTDDEGVSRIDLTHEYMRAVDDLHMDYTDLKHMSYNALKYAFVDDARKAELIAELDARFAKFEAGFAP